MRAVIVLVLLFAAQVEAQTPGASDTQAGKEIWQGYLGLQNDCKLCHGEHGEGPTLSSPTAARPKTAPSSEG